jgi:protein TonB
MGKSFGLSILMHAIVLLCFGIYRSPRPEFSSSSTVLQTRTLSLEDFQKEFPKEAKKIKEVAQKLKKAQLVQVDDRLKSEDAPHFLQKSFLGRHNQRFDQNTRAARVGEFKNILKEGLKDARDLFKITEEFKEKNPASTESKDTASLEKTPSPQGKTYRFTPNKESTKGRAPASLQNDSGPSGDGFSATDDYLPDIAIAANTLLNTREYKFASFYERIREKLNHQWQSRVRAEMENLYLQGVQHIEGERITKLRIALNPEGRVVKIEKYGSAGFHELDRAAIHAFEAAGPFPNPPRELLEASGQLLSIDWHFVVMGGRTGMRIRVYRSPAGL